MVYNEIHNRAKLIAVGLCCLLPCLSWSQGSGAPSAKWTTNDSILLYFEAITKIQQLSQTSLTTKQIVRDTLKAYMRGLDPFSDYLAPKEYATFRRAQDTHYAGIGMILSPTAEGELACIPYPNGPAAMAGVALDDVLLAVDDVRIAGESSLRVGMRIRGETGTTVRLRVKTHAGEEREVPIVRAPVQAQSVLVERRHIVPLVRILSFTTTTRREVLKVWKTFKPAELIVLDLRGNPGGSLYDAIDVAMLFLAEGAVVSRVQTEGKLKVYKRELPEAPFTNPLYIWQDGRTASAAEAFIAALQEAERAVTIGTQTFGKGVIQQVIPLADQSALYMTTGRLQTPNGKTYHGHGLAPRHWLAQAKPRLQDYLEQVAALLEAPAKRRREPAEADSPAPLPSTRPLSIGNINTSTTVSSHVLCFDKDYPTLDRAYLWAAELQASINTEYQYYTLERNQDNAVIYLVCLGPFQTLEDAEDQYHKLSNIIQTNIFIAQQTEPNALPPSLLSPSVNMENIE